MNGSADRTAPGAPLRILLVLVLFAGVSMPLYLARTHYLNPAPPAGRLPRLADVAGEFAARLPRCDRDRAREAARAAAARLLSHLEQALWLWPAALLAIAAAACAGLANRQANNLMPLWSSPLAAWLSKRLLRVQMAVLLVAPGLFVFFGLPLAAGLVLAIAAIAAAGAYLFTRNLPARL